MTGLIGARRWPHGRGVALFSGSRVLFADAFDRADSASTLGDLWTVIAGTFGIASGQAYTPLGDSNAIAVTDAGTANCRVRVTMAKRNTFSGLYLRVVDASNWLRYVAADSGHMVLVRSLDDTLTTVATLAATVASTGDIYEADMRGTAITLYLNGARLGDPQTVTDFATATKHGIGTGTGSALILFDDYRVTA